MGSHRKVGSDRSRNGIEEKYELKNIQAIFFFKEAYSFVISLIFYSPVGFSVVGCSAKGFNLWFLLSLNEGLVSAGQKQNEVLLS